MCLEHASAGHFWDRSLDPQVCIDWSQCMWLEHKFDGNLWDRSLNYPVCIDRARSHPMSWRTKLAQEVPLSSVENCLQVVAAVASVAVVAALVAAVAMGLPDVQYKPLFHSSCIFYTLSPICMSERPGELVGPAIYYRNRMAFVLVHLCNA